MYFLHSKHMSSLKVLPHIVIFWSVVNTLGSVQTQNSASSDVVLNGWKVVREGWPLEDFLDEVIAKRTQFYYYDKQPLIEFKWKLKQTLLDKIPDNVEYFRIWFKFWASYPENSFTHSLVKIGNRDTINLKKLYENYQDQWMSLHFVLTRDELDTFSIHSTYASYDPELEYRISAFKDFKLEYQTQTNKEAPNQKPGAADDNGLRVEGWQKYLVPPIITPVTTPETPTTTTSTTTPTTTTSEDSSTVSGGPPTTVSGGPTTTVSGGPTTTVSGGPPTTVSGGPPSTLPEGSSKVNSAAAPVRTRETTPETFIYFSSGCKEVCDLVFHKNRGNVKSAELLFQYWINGKSVGIEINNPSKILNSTGDKWESISIAIDGTQLDGLTISVAINDNDSYAAITNLKIVITHTDNTASELDCKSGADCRHWRLSGNSFWSEELSGLQPKDQYWYPTSYRNSLAIERNDNLFDDNVCLNIEYILLNQNSLKLRVIYNIYEENKNDSILEIRPGFGVIEESELCLRQLIALKAHKYEIVLQSSQEYIGNSIGILVKVKDPTIVKNVTWNFSEETVNFLSPNTSETISQWTQIHPNSQTNSVFTIEKEKITFSAKAKSRLPSTAILSSVWIKYHPNLHKTDPGFSLSADPTNYKQIYKSFTIRPMICDWVSHCTDVVLSPPLINITKSDQSFTFKFQDQSPREYIRLVFQVDYFKPGDSVTEEVSIDFDLKLDHFGDPCYSKIESKCQNGTCTSDPKVNMPNVPLCKCDPGYGGDNCDKKDYCSSNYTEDGKSGTDYCKDQSGSECEPLDDDFRCSCHSDDKILWSKTSRQCEKALHNQEDKTWTEGTDGILYPNTKENLLKYNLHDINATKYDICFNITYKTLETADLTLGYRRKEGTKQDLASISLFVNETKDLDLCLSDFYYGNNEEFELQFSVLAHFDTWNEANFHISKLDFRLEEKTRPLATYLDKWEQTKAKSTNRSPGDQYWKTVPVELFTNSTDTQNLFFTYSFTVTEGTPIKAYLISDWIKNDPKFKNSDNFYSVIYPMDKEKNFKLRQGYVYFDNEVIKPKMSDFPNRSPKPDPDNKDNIVSEKNPIEIPADQTHPFKIIFAIEIIGKTEILNKDLTIKIQKLSLGDPCFKYDNTQNNCNDKGLCSGIAPENFTCKCDAGSAGEHCGLDDLCAHENTEYDTNKEYCSSLPSLPLQDPDNCHVLTSTSYECICPEEDYFWDKDIARCIRVGHTNHTLTCEGKECEMFDKLLNDLEVSNRNVPALTSKTDPILPFYYSNTNEAALKLRIENLDAKDDACFKFRYLISENAQLGVSYGDLGSIQLTQTLDSLNTTQWFPEDPNGEGLCVSDLTKDNDPTFDLSFAAEINDQDNEIVVLKLIKTNDQYIQVVEKVKVDFEELPFLTHWSVMKVNSSFTFENQWPNRYPSSFWTHDNDDLVTFSSKGSEIAQRSYLVSNWINKDIIGQKLRFKFTNNSKDYFELKVFLYGEDMKETELALIQGTEKSTVQTVDIPNQESHFRVGFSVEYLSGQWVEFTLEKIDVGDPCVDDETNYETCTDRGQCLRDVVEEKLQFRCKCDQYYTDTRCERTDFCKFPHDLKSFDGEQLGDWVYWTGDDYCEQIGKGKCQNGRDKFGTFSCQCDQDFWNANLYNCTAFPKCLSEQCDAQTQICKEEEGCVCKEGYVNLNTTQELNCEEFDPCKTEHREAKDKSRGKACNDKNAECKAYGNGIDDYMCVCLFGYKANKAANMAETECLKKLCDFPSLNDCEQECSPDDTEKGYHCLCNEAKYVLNSDGKTCQLNETMGAKCNCTTEDTEGIRAYCKDSEDDSCVCKNGYRVETLDGGQGYRCRPNLEPYYDVCPERKATNMSDTLVCDCQGKYELDEETKLCKLKSICGEGGDGKKKCDGMNALCLVDTNALGEFKCDCPTGKAMDEKQVCIDVCEIKQDGRRRNDTCLDFRAKCNPIKLITMSTRDNVNASVYCECGPGHVLQDNLGCVIVTKTQSFTIAIKNNFEVTDIDNEEDKTQTPHEEYYFDLETLRKDIETSTKNNKIINEQAEQELKKDMILKNLKDHLTNILSIAGYDNEFAVKECRLNNEYYDCEITVTAKDGKDREDIGSLLKEICVDNDQNTKECFFLNYNWKPKTTRRVKREVSWNKDSVFSLTADADKLKQAKLELYDNCLSGTDICDQSQFSNCESQDPESSLYNCTCSDDFTVLNPDDPVGLPTEDGSVVNQYKCLANDLCSEKCKAQEINATCNYSPKKQDNNWIVDFICQCPDESAINGDGTQCLYICSGVDCHHGRCQPRGANGYACVCNEGWNGDYCENWHDYSLGGWIAGISVLAVVCVLLVLVVIYIARRVKRNDNKFEGSTQVLNDYSQTSYRVGQNREHMSGAVVNEAFARD